jgi:hypothetical protein
MLDGLGVSDYTGIEHLGGGASLLALLEDALDALAGLTGSLGVERANTSLRRSTCPSVSLRWCSKARGSSAQSAYFAIFGNAFRICFSA